MERSARGCDSRPAKVTPLSASLGVSYGWNGMNLGEAYSRISGSWYNGRDLTIIGDVSTNSKIESITIDDCTCMSNKKVKFSFTKIVFSYLIVHISTVWLASRQISLMPPR